MKTWIKGSLYSGSLLLLVAQFFPPNRTNPPTDAARTIHASLTIEPVVASALKRACNDCHSNLTVWPWYSRVAPASWVLVSDVKRGRKAINFSDWKSLNPQEQQEILPEICKEVTDRDMPPDEYVFLHPDARPTRTEITSICNWTNSVRQFGSEQAKKD